MKALVPLLALTLAACGGGGDKPRPRPIPRPPASAPVDAVLDWEIGPTGVNHSKCPNGNCSLGLPANPTAHPEGFEFEIGPTAEPHYVTKRTGPLSGVVRMTGRVEGDADAVIYGKECAVGSPSAVTLYFAAEGDRWTLKDGFRWWATRATVTLSGPGTFEIVASLDGYWSSVSKEDSLTQPALFEAAKRNAQRVGFTFANCTGYGHGAKATKSVRFIVTGFEVLPAPVVIPPSVGERG